MNTEPTGLTKCDMAVQKVIEENQVDTKQKHLPTTARRGDDSKKGERGEALFIYRNQVEKNVKGRYSDIGVSVTQALL